MDIPLVSCCGADGRSGELLTNHRAPPLREGKVKIPHSESTRQQQLIDITRSRYISVYWGAVGVLVNGMTRSTGRERKFVTVGRIVSPRFNRGTIAPED